MPYVALAGGKGDPPPPATRLPAHVWHPPARAWPRIQLQSWHTWQWRAGANALLAGKLQCRHTRQWRAGLGGFLTPARNQQCSRLQLVVDFRDVLCLPLSNFFGRRDCTVIFLDFIPFIYYRRCHFQNLAPLRSLRARGRN